MKQKEPILVLSEEMDELIDMRSWELRALLVECKLPTDKWSQIWERHSDEEGIFKELEVSTDLDIQRLVGWFKGVADALGTEESKLVKL